MTRFQAIVRNSTLVLLISFSIQASHAQQYFLPPAPEFRQDRFKTVILTETAIGVLASAGLYFLWYKKFPHSRFHFFNDNREWLQVDKVGHAVTAYNIGIIQHDLMRWCGVSPNGSIIIGSASALGYMSIIEVMDGFSKHWGFSKGDMLANIAGTAIFAMQQRFWGEQRISMKFSAHYTPFANYYPGELGDNRASRLLKDYNGQTYWLSFNVKSFLSSASSFPAWANIALGYGAEGMIGANSNPSMVNGKPIPSFNRIRQFYLAPDADLFRIQSSAPFNTAAYLLRTSKIPTPALELNSEG
ncbi:MAG TPA: DUF2279 domain-containing protein, partial [Chitinophagaceae bacterium]|nr:DUF2279 domain-containing protein [Chitinophagaceae bacterium]